MQFCLWFVFAFCCFLMVGCAGWPHSKAPILKTNTPLLGKVVANGEVETPAKVEATKTESVIPIPAKSTVTRTEATPTEPARTIVVVAAASEMRTTEQVETITQAKAFSPPSPSQVAAAAGVKWFYIAGALFAIAALGLGYTGHLKAAAFAVAGALLVPMLGQLASSHTAQLVAVGLGAVAAALWGAWHLMTAQQHAELVAGLKQDVTAAQAEARKLKGTLT